MTRIYYADSSNHISVASHNKIYNSSKFNSRIVITELYCYYLIEIYFFKPAFIYIEILIKMRKIAFFIQVATFRSTIIDII